jgi:acyl carrier protein
MGWPNDRFLPDDSFDALLSGTWDGLELVELMMDAEEKLGIAIPESGTSDRTKMRLGEVVDYLLALSRQWGKLRFASGKMPEKTFCASADVFWQMRWLLRESCPEKVPSFRLETPFRELLPPHKSRELANFVSRRFSVPEAFRLRVLGVTPVGWTWFVLSIAGPVAVTWNEGAMEGFYYALLITIPLLGILRLMSWYCWPRRVVTVADLVKWILLHRKWDADSARAEQVATRFAVSSNR